MTASAEARDTALLAAQAAADKLATDISIVDVGDRLAITDAFLLASAPNERQVQSIVDAIEERLREHGIKPVRREGVAESRWVLLDYIDIVVHVQHTEERAYYALERLWKDCPTIPFADRALQPHGGRHADRGRHGRRPAGRDDAPPARTPTGELRSPGAARCRGWCCGGTAGPSGTPTAASRASSTRRWTRWAAARPRSRPRTWSPPGCRREETVVVSSDLSRAAETAARSPACSACRCAWTPGCASTAWVLGGADPRRGGRAVPRPVRRLDGRAARSGGEGGGARRGRGAGGRRAGRAAAGPGGRRRHPRRHRRPAGGAAARHRPRPAPRARAAGQLRVERAPSRASGGG